MGPICVLTDAHLLFQADWVDDENALKEEAEEVLDNFERALKKVADDSPSAIILAGDMFDTKTESGQRVAFREAEKYMLRIRKLLANLVDGTRCKIYVLRGNHDSQPVLRGLEAVLKEKFSYERNQVVKIGETSLGLMDTHYLTGTYDIPPIDIPRECDILVMHECVPIHPGILGPPKETFVSICKKHRLVLNGHMHFFNEKTLGIPNFCLLPAFVPSREIKGNWMLKYRYENGTIETRQQETPFGYVSINGTDYKFKRYKPLQVIVRVELIGKNAAEFNQGIQQVYELLMDRADRRKLRVWITTNADPIIVDRLLWDKVSTYVEIKTLDILSERGATAFAPIPNIEQEFGDAAFTRQELLEKVMQALDSEQQNKAVAVFERILSPQVLAYKNPETRQSFRDLLEIMSRGEQVSGTFVEKCWEISKGG